LTRGVWLLTALVVAALFAFMPSAAFGANPSANLDQCANGQAPSPSNNGCNGTPDTDWVNGNLGASKAVYFEGDSIPYRLTFDNLSLSSHTVTIEWDTTKSGTHALDYITSYNQSVLDANPCLGVSGCNPFSFDEFPIPADPQVTGAGVTPIAGNLTMFGGDITAVSAYSYPDGTGFAGDKSARITITFTATTANPVLAWGGHIASRQDWGLTASAVSIPGSPYHTRLIDLDGAGGNQDRSLSAEAVIFPGFIHIVKNTTGGDATFGYTASPSPLSDFNIATVGGTGENDFDNITNFQTYTVNEATLPAHWVFDSLNCSVGSPNGGTQTVTNRSVAINLMEGEQVTCTYANHHAVNSPTIATLLSDDSITVGGTIHDSSTLTGATSDAGGTVKYRYYSVLADCQAGTFATTGGTSAGDKTVTNGVVPNSDDATFNTAGTYYWRAFYSGDGNNNAASSTCQDETLVVGKASPTIATLLSDDSITVGGTIHDSSTLTGATSGAGGTVKYRYYSVLADCQAGTFATTGGTSAGDKTVTNGVVPNSDDATFNTAGTYYWRAFYSGDGNNNAASSTCQDETLVVGKASPTLTTDAGGDLTLGVNGSDLSDTATLSGATSDATGTITYHLYFGTDCSAENEVAGSPVTNPNVDGNGDYVSPSIHVTKAGSYRWVANYGGDDNNEATHNGCNGENENLVVKPRDTSLTTDAGGPYRIGEGGTVDLTDTATLSGGTSDATGTITFTLYGPDSTPNSTEGDCSAENQVDTASATVNGANGNEYTSSPAISVSEPGIYHWKATYVSGDGKNSGSASDCGAEGENPVVIAPHISVVKTPDEQVIRNGDSVSWTIQVINDGSSTLNNVTVTDAQAPGCARTSADIPALASMDPGDTVTYTCSRDANTASFTNVAVATGKPEVGDNVSAEDSAHVTVINPAISISKTPHTQTVAFAGTVTFTIGVKNTGDSTLTNVRVTDAQAPGCARTSADIPQLASMAPGDELSYSCTVANVTANFTNVAVATGTPEVGPDVSANDSAAVTVGPPPPPVTHPAISIVKDPKSQTVTVGKTATFKITVTNTGDVALTNVTVTDALSPNCNRTIGTLAPGASTSYTCTRPDVTASFNNVAVVTGTAGEKTVTAQDTAPVTAKKAFVPPKVVPKVVSHKKPKATG
jgi:uncharacterized repeat protein (TIGR01451 family)